MAYQIHVDNALMEREILFDLDAILADLKSTGAKTEMICRALNTCNKLLQMLSED